MGKAVLDFVEKDKDQKKAIEKFEEELGLSIDAIRLEGDDRITSAFAFTMEPGDDRWGLQIETLNFEALGAMAGAVTLLRSKASVGGGDSFFLPDTGMAMCDIYIIAKHGCGERTGNSAMKEEARADEIHYKSKLAASPGNKSKIDSECMQKQADFMSEHKECKTP